MADSVTEAVNTYLGAAGASADAGGISVSSGLAAKLKAWGIDPDHSLPIKDGNELVKVAGMIKSMVSDTASCVITSYMTGAPQREDLGWFDSDALSSQTSCHTDMTLDEALAPIKKTAPELAAWLKAKGTVKQKSEKAYLEAQGKKAQQQVIEKGVDKAGKAVEAGAKALEDAADSATFLVRYAVPIAVVAGLGILYIYGRQLGIIKGK